MKTASPKNPKLKFDETQVRELIADLVCDSKILEDPSADEWKAAFDLTIGDQRTEIIFKKFNLSPENPFAWRSLLEAFFVYYASDRGPKLKITRSAILELAVDCGSVLFERLNSEWEDEAAAAFLKKHAPYCLRYQSLSQDALRKRIATIRERFGPMDVGFLRRVRDAYPDRLFSRTSFRDVKTPFD